MANYILKIYKRLLFLYYKNRKPKSEEEFYKIFYTLNPNWNKAEPNQDESLRWEEIVKSLNHLKINLNKTSILEIGCGRGWLCNKLTLLGAKTIGVDPMEPVIKYARKLFPGLEFHTDTPSGFLSKNQGRYFELVVTSEVIEHVIDKEEFLKSIYNLIEPSGYLVLTTPRLEHYDDFLSIWGEDSKQPVEEWLS